VITFKVDDMTCGHCVSKLTQALRDLDKHAKITITLEQHLISIESVSVSVEEVEGAISEAGYMPLRVENA
jgi:copper chaperone